MTRRIGFALFVVAVVAGLTLACYGRVLLRGEAFGFRDAADYYDPLHRRVQQEWAAGRWPLWEPEENAGMPLLGNPTAAVLYPGKLVFAALPYALAARWYVVGHTLLAFAAMVLLLKHWRVSGVGCVLGGLSYAFGGPILFQYCNVIYLVGAAWLPLGLRAVDRWLRQGRRLAIVELAVILSLQILGGDPETAYLTGLAAGGYALWLRNGEAWTEAMRRSWKRIAVYLALGLAAWCAAVLAASLHPEWFRIKNVPAPWSRWVRPVVLLGWAAIGMRLAARWRATRVAADRSTLVPRLAGLLLAAGLAAAIAAAQLFPVVEFISRSGRAAGDGLLNIYGFSLPPLRLVELLWPNIFGSPFGGNRAWLAAVPIPGTDQQQWVNTLYLGALTMLLALAGATARRSTPERGWLLGLAVVSLLASFGDFGSPLWIARALGLAGNAKSGLQSGDGGVYWFLSLALPGFDQFRYPSKLTTITVAALAALAGFGWDAVVDDPSALRRRLASWATAWLGATLLGLAATIVFRSSLLARLSSPKLTTIFGPVDAPGAIREAQWGLTQAGLALAAALLLLRLATTRPRLAGLAAIGLLAVDLGCANARVVVGVPQDVFESAPQVLRLIAEAERERPSGGPFRIHRVPVWTAVGWAERPSDDRVTEVARWSMATAVPKAGIPWGLPYTMTLGVTELEDYRWLFSGFRLSAKPEAARTFGVPPGSDLLVRARRAYDMWGSRYFVLPFYSMWDDEYRGLASFLTRSERIYPRKSDLPPGPDDRARELAWVKDYDFQIRRNYDAFRRAWVVHAARRLPDVAGLTREGRNQALLDMLYAGDVAWNEPGRVVHDPRVHAWIEDSVLARTASAFHGGYPTASEVVQVVSSEPQRVELEATLETPGMVVLADVYYPGWELTIDGRPAEIHRANFLMRGAVVEPGRHRLVYTYRPASFRVGLWCSAAGLLVSAALVLAWRRASPMPWSRDESVGSQTS